MAYKPVVSGWITYWPSIFLSVGWQFAVVHSLRIIENFCAKRFIAFDDNQVEATHCFV